MGGSIAWALRLPFRMRKAQSPMLYFAPVGALRGGTTIFDVTRHAWERLIRRQWLIFYPLAVALINILAFFAVYAAGGGVLRWGEFFAANLDRWQYVRDHLFSPFSLSPRLAAAIVAGLGVCALAAMIRAPLFRAIAGPAYPTAPRTKREAINLASLYLFTNLVVWLLPLAVPAGSLVEQLAALIATVVALLLVFADYVVVFENLSFFPALRRSVRLLVRRPVAVVAVFIVLQLVYTGLHALYGHYYHKADGVFILLPLSQILIESLIALFADLVLIFLYEQIRRRGPA
jgi:hypothetical protein